VSNGFYFGSAGSGSTTSNTGVSIFQVFTPPTGNLNLAGTRVVNYDGVTVDGLTGATAAVTTYGAYTVVYCTISGSSLSFKRYTGASGYQIEEDGAGGSPWTNSSLNGTVSWSTVPTAPGTIAASRTGRDVTVTAGAAASNGGNTISAYKVQYRSSSNGGSTWGAWGSEQTLTSLAYTYTGLTASLTYQFRVYANNARGSSAATTSSNLFVPAGGKRYDGAAFVSTTTAKRWTGSAWTDLTIAKRWSGSAWVDLS
jgi:hypothetical protein